MPNFTPKTCVFALILACWAGPVLASVVVSPKIQVYGDNLSLIFGLGTASSYSPPSASLLFNCPGPALSSTIQVWVNGTVYDLANSTQTYVVPMWSSGTGTGAFVEGVCNLSGSPLQLTLHYEIADNPQSGATADTMKVKMTLQNMGAVAVTYGVRLMYDTMINGNDGANISVNNGASVVPTNSIFSLAGTGVPGSWWGYDVNPPGAPNLVGRGSLWGNLVGEAATQPDALEVADWSMWPGLTWIPAPLGTGIFDSSVVLWWTGTGAATIPTLSLAPGDSRSIITYYGINDGTLQDPYTAIPTPTHSPTRTRTPTRTPSASATATPTASSTATPTLTQTGTATPTASASPTFSHSPTLSATPSVSASPTPTSSQTATASPSPTASATPTPSGTPTQSFTATLSPTPTESATASASATATPTRSQTPTRTSTPTSSCSATQSATATLSPTPSVSPSSSASPTATSSRTATGSSTATPSASSSPTGSPSSSATATATGTPTASSTPTFTASSTQSPTATLTATPTASPSQTSTRSQTATASASPTASATATPSASPTQSPTATPTPTSTASPTHSPTPSATATGTQTPSFTASPTHSPTATASATGTITLTFSASPTVTPTPSITLTFSASPTRTPSAPFKGSVRVYNSAGEWVATLETHLPLYKMPTGLTSATASFAPDEGGSGILKLLGPELPLVWSGRTDSGQLVSGGTYNVVVQVMDPFGKLESWTAPLTVIRSDRSTEVAIYNSAGEEVWRRSVSPQAPGRVELSNSSIVAGGSGLKIRFGSDSLDFVIWDGSGSQGQALSSGSYLVKVTQAGSSGKGTTAYTVTLLQANSDIFREAVAAPNPVRAATDTVRVSLLGAATGITAWGEAYNLVGEHVGSLAAVTGGKLFWRVSPALASGVYLLQINARDSRGRLKSAPVKVAIVR